MKSENKFCLKSFGENSSVGYILEVDLKYPEELHELQSYYPLAPEKLKISPNMLSDHCKNTGNEYAIQIGGVNKLVPNLGYKIEYVLHCKNLQLYF